jgi:hypothetical protein
MMHTNIYEEENWKQHKKTGNRTITGVQDLKTEILPLNILQGATETIKKKQERQEHRKKAGNCHYGAVWGINVDIFKIYS